jgi:hypothetical protein
MVTIYGRKSRVNDQRPISFEGVELIADSSRI